MLIVTPAKPAHDSQQGFEIGEKAGKKNKKNWHWKKRKKKEVNINLEDTLTKGWNTIRGKKNAGQNQGQNQGQN